jgi:hypothetical protein
MKTHLIPVGAAVALALLITGCETDGGVSARAQEKSAVYSALKPWQKKYVDKGAIAMGFTTDMVYIAMGRPDKVETKDLPEGKTDLWTYKQYYPDVDAIHGFGHADFSTESAYQPQPSTTQLDAQTGKTVPTGMARGGADTIGRTGGPQGGTIEPADLRSYTIKVLFANGKVVRMGADPNP